MVSHNLGASGTQLVITTVNLSKPSMGLRITQSPQTGLRIGSFIQDSANQPLDYLKLQWHILQSPYTGLHTGSPIQDPANQPLDYLKLRWQIPQEQGDLLRKNSFYDDKSHNIKHSHAL